MQAVMVEVMVSVVMVILAVVMAVTQINSVGKFAEGNKIE